MEVVDFRVVAELVVVAHVGVLEAVRIRHVRTVFGNYIHFAVDNPSAVVDNMVADMALVVAVVDCGVAVDTFVHWDYFVDMQHAGDFAVAATAIGCIDAVAVEVDLAAVLYWVSDAESCMVVAHYLLICGNYLVAVDSLDRMAVEMDMMQAEEQSASSVVVVVDTVDNL